MDSPRQYQRKKSNVAVNGLLKMDTHKVKSTHTEVTSHADGGQKMSDAGWFLAIDPITQVLFAAARVGLTVMIFFALVVFVILAFGGRG